MHQESKCICRLYIINNIVDVVTMRYSTQSFHHALRQHCKQTNAEPSTRFIGKNQGSTDTVLEQTRVDI